MNTNDRLTAFVYFLVRDELPFGRLERILAEVQKLETAMDDIGAASEYSDHAQFEYALRVAARLEDGEG